MPLVGCLSFIYALCRHNAKAFYPPAQASNPQAPVYMNLQPPRHTARTSLHGRWALTPPSHPYPCGRLFSSALLCLRRQLSVRKWSALCCPDFPPLPCGNGDRPIGCFYGAAKVIKNFGLSLLCKHLYSCSVCPKCDFTVACSKKWTYCLHHPVFLLPLPKILKCMGKSYTASS